MTPNSFIEEKKWKEEFDKKFDYPINAKQVKIFISNLLSDQKAAILKEVRGMKIKKEEMSHELDFPCKKCGVIRIYSEQFGGDDCKCQFQNQILSDLLEKLK